MASGAGTSSSREPPSVSQDEEEEKDNVIYSCALEAGDPVDVGNAPFLPFTSPLGRIRPEAVVHPCLDKFYLDRIDQVHTFPGRTFYDLVTLSHLATWGLGPVPTAENLGHEETTRQRITTIRENKEKTITSGDEDSTAPPIVQKTSIQTGKRKSKSISNTVDLDNLPSRRGPKKQKPGKASLPKVPKFAPPMVNLDDHSVDVEPIQMVHLVQTDPPPSNIAPRKAYPSESSESPPNLVLDESYAWRTFKGIITNNEVNSCYTMSVKDFECSTIHDLFNAMSKFYTASCQAEKLYEEAKTAKEKAKKLNKEVLLKKGELIRLIEDFNCLQRIETKLKNEVEELKADVVEKDTRIAHLEGKVSGFSSSLEKAREEAILAFKKFDKYKNRLDNHYVAGYEDFCANANEAFPDLNFDSFKIPLATESFLLATSSKDVNVVDDANNEVTQDNPKTGNVPSDPTK
nr:uncharacterized protein LOC112030919 [Quercus suber]